jgi:subtilisin family serine protease
MSPRSIFARRQSLFRKILMLEQLEERCMLSASSLPTDLNPANIQVVPGAYAPGDILVKFVQTTTNYTGLSLLPGTTVSQQLGIVPGLYEITLSPQVSVDQALAAYRADSRVLDAEPDPLLGVTQSLSSSAGSGQWALQQINALQAFQTTTGNSKIVVAVLDTGIDYNHPDLYSNIWINQAEIPLSRMKNLVDVYHDGYISWRDLNSPINQGLGKITDINKDGVIDAADILAPMTLNAQGQDTGLGGWANPSNTQDGDTAHPDDLIGWNFVANNNQPMDDNGHGTNVAGIVGATGQAGNVVGVDPNVQLMDLKWEGASGTGFLTDYINALNYSVQHGAQISNNSWTIIGSLPSYYLGLLTAAVQNAQAHGDIFVAAAGNTTPNGINDDVNLIYPADIVLPNVVSVAATDSTNALASFSNYGPNTIALAAPGVSILNTSFLNGVAGYTTYSGTSMAAPEVAGALALVWGENPGWTYSQVINQVLNTVTLVPALKGKVKTGGLLNVSAAVGWTASDAIALQVASATNISPTPANNLSTIQVTFSKAIVPSTFTTAGVTLTGPSGTNIPISMLYAIPGSNNTQFTLVFTNQTASGKYTLTIGTGVQDNRGHPLPAYQTTFSLTFAPVVKPPAVLSVTLIMSGSQLSGLAITFSTSINPSTLTLGLLTLVDPTGHVIPITSVTSSANNTQFFLQFGLQSKKGNYALRIGAGVTDLFGNQMGVSIQNVLFT